MHRALAVGVLAVAAPAHAIGVCEGYGVSYAPPRMFSEAWGAFAVPSTSEWCEFDPEADPLNESPDPDGDPRTTTGTIHYVELFDGKVLGAVSSARGVTAKRLADSIGFAAEHVANGVWTILAARGYRALATRTKTCTTRIGWGTAAPGSPTDPFPTRTMYVDIMAGKRLVHRTELGAASTERRGAGIVRAHFARGRNLIAVWAQVPRCTAGYTEPGSDPPCEPGDTYRVVKLDVVTIPALAVCFAQ